MPRRFDFISPGVSIREIDQSTVTPDVEDDGILIIGQAPQGPANKPIKIRNLENFYQVFGNPISGKGVVSSDVWRDGNTQLTTYGMYAAQAWLASETSPVNFVRLLGEDQVTSKQAASYTKAGWNIGAVRHATIPANIANAFGLFIFPSGAAGGGATFSGQLAAVLYSSGSTWALSGTMAVTGAGDFTSRTGNWLNTVVRSSTTGQACTFTLVHSSSTASTKHVVHFDRTKKDGYIRNVLNCNPQKMESINHATTAKYWLGETYDVGINDMLADESVNAAGKQYGILVPLSDNSGHDYTKRNRAATAPETGWFINRNPNPKGGYGSYTKSTHDKLFKIVSLHEGTWMQNNFGIRIENLRMGSTANPNSSFSVVLVNSNGEEVERFDNCNLNESSANFIGKVIGDQYQTWNTTSEKYDLYGEYPNNSDYIRVKMANDWKAGISDTKMIPFGVWGPTKPKKLTFHSGSTTAGTNTFSQKADDSAWLMGHVGASTHFAMMDANLHVTCSWPDLKLTDENSNNGGNYDKTYVFGVRHMLNTDSQSKKMLWYSPDYKDLVRAGANSLDVHGDGSATTQERSWIFSLDDICQDSSNTSLFFYKNAMHAAGASITAKSGSAALLTYGIKQFNAPFFGGADGLDPRIVDPFSNQTGLNGTNVKTHYAYYTVDRVLDMVKDKDLINYDMISMPGLLNTGLINKMIRNSEERADNLAIIDIDSGYLKSFENSGTEQLAHGDGGSKRVISNAIGQNYDTSYAAAYYPPVRIRDTVSATGDVTVVPSSVAAIGAIGRSEGTSQGPWFAPAGFNRGGIGVLGGSAGPRVVGTLEHLTKQDRDDLYEENINPIARFPSIGEIVIFGQKTLQQTPSALDRINVRRLMIYLKKRIGRVADSILFDQNVETTWFRFKSRADIILSDVKARFGITEYKLVLDKTTTTADLIDRNIMYAKIFVKPARAIEFIAIDFVITRTGVEF